jgi:predicted PurR-regulated permease PerM
MLSLKNMYIFAFEPLSEQRIMKTENTRIGNYNFEKVVDMIIRLVILYMLISWCFNILSPFGTILIWGTVIALAVYPAYSYIVKVLKGRRVLSAMVITIFLVCILLVPSWLIGKSLFNGIEQVRGLYIEGQPLIPPPGEAAKNWPGFAKPLLDLWTQASENLKGVSIQYKEELTVAGTWLAKTLAGIGKGVLEFVASIFLAAVFLVYSEPIGKAMTRIFIKLAGKKGEEFASITAVTVRNVFKGVLGVAFIQTTLVGLGFFIAGVPHAGLWTVLCLVLAIVQIGVGPIAIPIAIYMFTATDTLTATLLALWMIPVTISDNILRPLLMGRGALVPMLVIFMGAIGGLMYNGFIGLFLGAIILSIMYKLFLVWLGPDTEKEIEKEIKAES